jgi:hypothetical protein
MAVFALDYFMGRGKNLLFLGGMAIPAVFLSLVFNLEGLPFRYVPLPVPAIHVPPFMDSEVFGHHESPGDQDDRHHGQNHIQGSQYMQGYSPFMKTWEQLFSPYRGEQLKGWEWLLGSRTGSRFSNPPFPYRMPDSDSVPREKEAPDFY